MNEALRRMYDDLPATYGLVNRVLTFGMDDGWRRRAAELAGATVATDEPSEQWLDVCCGTGDMTAWLRRRAPRGTRLVGADYSRAMLDAAVARSIEDTSFTVAAAARLPFRDATFDVVTMAFATRNVAVTTAALVAAFAEFRRVLRPGGAFVTVETSQPPSTPFRLLFHTYVRLFVTPVGWFLSGSRPGYRYLASSMLAFPGAPVVAGYLRDAGFADVAVHPVLFGAVAVHVARAGC